jgi:hypothetical protein
MLGQRLLLILRHLIKSFPSERNVQLLMAPFSTIIIWFLTVLYSLFYVMSEWIFLITKPTFDVRIGPYERIASLLFSIALASLLVSLPILIVYLITIIIKSEKVISRINNIICVIPTLILTLLLIMLTDNFTYTLFKSGILTISPYTRILYLLFFIIIGYINFNSIRITAKKLSYSRLIRSDKWKYINLFGGMIIFVIIWAGFQFSIKGMPKTRSNPTEFIHRPNIILITGDGLNADRMSVYGYERKTTPQIEKIASGSLMAMNSYTNSSDTQGSLISIFTGKTPIDTGVLYPPDTLMEIDAYDHLPGILHDAGYATYQFGYPFYADANSANVMAGFDYVNNVQSYQTVWSFLDRVFPSYHQLFIRQLVERLSSRIKLLLWLENIKNNNELLSGKLSIMDDQDKIEITKAILTSSSTPVFIHLHLLGTHGPRFKIQNRLFSQNHDELTNWDKDYYDDAILGFDSMVGDIYQYIDKIGLTSDTLLIIGSDHGQQWVSNIRIPLIIHFPDGDHKGKITFTTQNIDIFPTLLDYLTGEEQNGREGKSLLGIINESRPIYSLGVDTILVTDDGRILLSTRINKPPFYQFGFIGLVECDKWFKISLDQLTFDSGNVLSTYPPCNPFQEIDKNKAIKLMKEYLGQNGLNTSLLQNLDN